MRIFMPKTVQKLVTPRNRITFPRSINMFGIGNRFYSKMSSDDTILQAIYGNNVNIVKLLLSKDPKKFRQQKDQEGNGLLHHAININNPDLIKLLLAQGFDLFTQNNEGKTALDIVKTKSNKKSYNAIIEYVLDKLLFSLNMVNDERDEKQKFIEEDLFLAIKVALKDQKFKEILSNFKQYFEKSLYQFALKYFENLPADEDYKKSKYILTFLDFMKYDEKEFFEVLEDDDFVTHFKIEDPQFSFLNIYDITDLVFHFNYIYHLIKIDKLHYLKYFTLIQLDLDIFRKLQDKDGKSPLHIALNYYLDNKISIKIIMYLLNKVDINLQNFQGQTILNLILEHSSSKSLELLKQILLQNMPNYGLKNSQGFNLLYLAFFTGQHQSFFAEMLTSPMNFNYENSLALIDKSDIYNKDLLRHTVEIDEVDSRIISLILARYIIGDKQFDNSVSIALEHAKLDKKEILKDYQKLCRLAINGELSEEHFENIKNHHWHHIVKKNIGVRTEKIIQDVHYKDNLDIKNLLMILIKQCDLLCYQDKFYLKHDLFKEFLKLENTELASYVLSKLKTNCDEFKSSIYNKGDFDSDSLQKLNDFQQDIESMRENTQIDLVR